MIAISHTLRDFFADCVFCLRRPQFSKQNTTNIRYAVATGKPFLITLQNGEGETATLNDGFGLFDKLNMSRTG